VACEWRRRVAVWAACLRSSPATVSSVARPKYPQDSLDERRPASEWLSLGGRQCVECGPSLFSVLGELSRVSLPWGCCCCCCFVWRQFARVLLAFFFGVLLWRFALCAACKRKCVCGRDCVPAGRLWGESGAKKCTPARRTAANGAPLESRECASGSQHMPLVSAA